MDQKFFICNTCGNIIAMVKESGVPVECCGERPDRFRKAAGYSRQFTVTIIYGSEDEFVPDS